MRFSIVTISFNQAPFLARAIDSVLAQAGDGIALEYVVVDPGSTDGSREIIDSYGDAITARVYEPDDGPADGLNRGFARTTGDLMGYLNADDAFLPGALARAAEWFERLPDTGILFGDGWFVDGRGRALRRFRSAPFTPARFIAGAAVVMQQSTFFRRSAWDRVGAFNTDNRTSWDAELVLEMMLAGEKARNVHEDWSVFTIHDGSITGSQRLADESARQHLRYFQRVTGRAPGPLDRANRLVQRGLRYLLDPAGTMLRAREAVSGPPAVRFPHLELPPQ